MTSSYRTAWAWQIYTNSTVLGGALKDANMFGVSKYVFSILILFRQWGMLAYDKAVVHLQTFLGRMLSDAIPLTLLSSYHVPEGSNFKETEITWQQYFQFIPKSGLNNTHATSYKIYSKLENAWRWWNIISCAVKIKTTTPYYWPLGRFFYKNIYNE